MPRRVLLPAAMRDRLHLLTQIVEETEGILFYRNQDGTCPLEGMYMTGMGSVGHVTTDPARTRVLNTFFEGHPGLRYIHFHTHTLGTVAQCGEYFANHFSGVDEATIAENLRADPAFMALLATPRHLLLAGRDDPALVVVPTPVDYEAQRRVISDDLHRVEARLGVHLRPFSGFGYKQTT